MAGDLFAVGAQSVEWGGAVSEAWWLARLLLGSVFVVSGVAKFVEWRRFADTLTAMEIFSWRLSRGIARVLPPFEILLGICLIAGWKLAVSGRGALLMLVGFTLTLTVYRWRGGKELACGCFAEFDDKTPTSIVIARDLFLLGAGLPLLREQTLPQAHGPEQWFWAAVTVAGLVLAWSMVHRLADTILIIRWERRYWEE